MVRRPGVSSLDSGAESAVYGEESPDGAGPGTAAAKAQWGGGGGRWLVWPMRVILWAALLVIAYRGVMAIALNEKPASTNSTTSTPAKSVAFPVTLGEAYALDFGRAYLNFSPATATERARQLANFIPANVRALEPQFGWNGAGSQQLQSEQVAGIDVRSAQTAVVTLLAVVNGRTMELGVPLYASGGGIVVSGLPAVLAAPPAASPPPTRGKESSDAAVQSALWGQLPAFFKAYASGDQATLNRYVAPGASLTGLGGAVSYRSIASILVPRGGATRDITVTVNWVFPGQVRGGISELTTTYDMSVIDQQSGRWYVKEIRASTQPMGTQ
jgi:Conjugative transposon protein TcpC